MREAEIMRCRGAWRSVMPGTGLVSVITATTPTAPVPGDRRRRSLHHPDEFGRHVIAGWTCRHGSGSIAAVPKLIRIATAAEIHGAYSARIPGCGVRTLARRFGVSKRTVQRIVRGRWRGGERPPRLERRPTSHELELRIAVIGGD